MTARKGNWFQTYTGRRFYPMDPRPEDFDLKDIAHALANVNRYGGHLDRPYSVAQHSVLVSRHCPPGLEMCGLMHDAPEAYIGDMVKPLKLMLPQFQEIEDGVWRALAKRFDLPEEMPDEVKRVDLQMLGTEVRDLMDQPVGDWHLALGVDLLPIEVTPWDWQKAEAEFLYRYLDLRLPPEVSS